MDQQSPPSIHLKDYLPAPYVIESLFLNFKQPHATRGIAA
jgi:hypothetical protein